MKIYSPFKPRTINNVSYENAKDFMHKKGFLLHKEGFIFVVMFYAMIGDILLVIL